jgi:hypothetical protein
MKTYTVILAEDVPHYATAEIRAANDLEAIEAAKSYDRDGLVFEPAWENAVCRRVVEIVNDGSGKSVAVDIAVDEYFLRNGGESERILCDAAPELLSVLRDAGKFDWVANAAVTSDIVALRKICLQYARWWNEQALPAIAKATGSAS